MLASLPSEDICPSDDEQGIEWTGLAALHTADATEQKIEATFHVADDETEGGEHRNRETARARKGHT
jgi:hypothetical protein